MSKRMLFWGLVVFILAGIGATLGIFAALCAAGGFVIGWWMAMTNTFSIDPYSEDEE